MKTRRLFLVVLIVALIVTIMLISLEQYYVAVALIVGTLIMRHRELWSLIKKRKLPPVDERVMISFCGQNGALNAGELSLSTLLTWFDKELDYDENQDKKIPGQT